MPQTVPEKMALRREALFRACHKCSFEMREIKRKHSLIGGVKSLEPLRFGFLWFLIWFSYNYGVSDYNILWHCTPKITEKVFFRIAYAIPYPME